MINNITLQGRLVKDVELQTTNSGTNYCNFTVAWSETYGETENKLFLNCIAWHKTAELIAKHFHKGKEIIVEGNLRTETYEKDGENRSVIKAVVNRVHFCGSKNEQTTETKEASSDAFKNMKPVNDDEGLPF